MAADMSVAKSAFAGAGSFGQSVANSAASIYSSSATTLAKLQTQNLMALMAPTAMFQLLYIISLLKREVKYNGIIRYMEKSCLPDRDG